MHITDATGSSRGTGVNTENRLMSSCVSASLEHYINHKEGQAYSLLVSQTPTGANDCFLYIKNNSDTDMVVEELNIYAATDEIIEIKVNDSGTTSGGTAATPVNLNAGSGNLADCTCETGNDITGLSGGSTVERLRVNASTQHENFNMPQDLIIPLNSTLTIYAVTGAIALEMSLYFNFHSSELD